MISTTIARISAFVLAVPGLLLLYAVDEVSAVLESAGLSPRGTGWMGQLLGAAWLGVAALNWLSKGTAQGGIYGRPIVMANWTLYLISAFVLLQPARRSQGILLWTLFSIAAAMAITYGALLFRGPFDKRP